MLGLKVNNLAEAIGHARRLEQTTLKNEIERLNKQSRRLELTTERHKAAFELTRLKKHKIWWNSDAFVRDYLKVDFEEVLNKRLRERLESEQRDRRMKQVQTPQKTSKLPKLNDKNAKNEQKNTKNEQKPAKNDSSSKITAQQKNKIHFISETEKLLQKVNENELKFPELKEKLLEQYQKKSKKMAASRSSINERLLQDIIEKKDSKKFMNCAERFLFHKPYNIECHEKIVTDELLEKHKEKLQEYEKYTMKKCGEKFGDIIKAFEDDNKSENDYDDYYY